MPGKYQDPEKTVFVNNLEHRVTDEILWELFLQAGPLINVHIPVDRATGKNKSFAFITYRSQCSVSYACELFNQLKLFKRPIYCKPTDNNSKDNKASSTPTAVTASPNFATPVRPPNHNSALIQVTPSPSPALIQIMTSPSPQFDRSRENDSFNDRDRSRNDRRFAGDYNRGFESPTGTFRNHDDHNRNLDDRHRNQDDRYRSSGDRYRNQDDRYRRYDSDQRSYDNGQRQRYGGSFSPAYQQAVSNNIGQINRSYSYDSSRSYEQQPPRNSPSNYGPVRNDPSRNHRMGRRQKSQPY